MTLLSKDLPGTRERSLVPSGPLKWKEIWEIRADDRNACLCRTLLRQLQRQCCNALPQAGMMIGNGVGNRTGLISFEHHLQSVVFTANLIVGHLVPPVLPNILERPAAI